MIGPDVVVGRACHDRPMAGTVPMRGRSVRGRCRRTLAWVTVVALALVGVAVASPAGVGVAADATSRFVPLAPTRVLDTRPGEDPADDGASGVVAAGGQVRVQLTGRAGLPSSGVSAVVLNVTMTEASAPGFVQVLPSGNTDIGRVSNLNVESAGQTIANQVTVPVGADGAVSIYTQGGGQLIADVFGYFTPAIESTSGRYVPLAAPSPRRVLDTRESGIVPAGGTVRVAVSTGTSLGGGVVAPGQASAVVLNLTVTEATDAGFWQVVPTNGATALGASSNLNVTRAGQTLSNQVIVPLGADGTVTVFGQRGGHVIVDIAGVMTGASSTRSAIGLYVPITPGRLVDTRDAGNTSRVGPIAAAGELEVQVGNRFGIPADAAAVAANVTMTEASGAGFVQVLPTGRATLGATSTVNVASAGQTIPNAAYATLGDGAKISLYTQRGGQLLADATGWFTGVPLPPQFAYVGTYNQGVSSPSPGITRFRFDPVEGTLTSLGVTASQDPSFLAMHPNGRFLYTVNELSPTGSVEAYAIDAATGALTILDRRTVGNLPAHLVVDPTGSYVLVGNYSGATWQVVAIDADGGLGAVTSTVTRTGSGPSPRQLAPHPHGLAFDPSGRYVATADLGADRLEVFRLVNGGLQSVSTVAIAPGAGPRHVAFSTDGKVLYLLNELTANIWVLPFNDVTGSVGSFRQVASMVPAGFPSERSGAEIVVHPGGQFLFASNRRFAVHPQSDSIVRYRIDPATGTLTTLGWTTTGISVARTMGLDPTGRWLYVLNQGGDTVQQFEVNTTTGDLSLVRTTTLRQPVSIAFTG